MCYMLNYLRILSGSGDLLSFSVPEGTEKIARLWFPRGVNAQVDTIDMTF